MVVRDGVFFNIADFLHIHNTHVQNTKFCSTAKPVSVRRCKWFAFRICNAYLRQSIPIHQQVEKSPFHMPWKESIQGRHIMDCIKIQLIDSHRLFRQDCSCHKTHLLYQHQSTDGFVVFAGVCFLHRGWVEWHLYNVICSNIHTTSSQKVVQ